MDDSSQIDQRYLDGFLSERKGFKKSVIEKDLDLAIDRMKTRMFNTGILTKQTYPLIDIVVDKLKQENIQG